MAGVLTFVILLETGVLHLVLRKQHPWIAWTLTLSSVSLLPWIWKKFRTR
jgi:hypothetical protein